jgi:hypothetical protein
MDLLTDGGTMSRLEHIAITFPEEGVTALARLLWDQAPGVCEQITSMLPIEARAQHAVYSGSEIAVPIPELPELAHEHPTTDVSAGDVAYAYVHAGRYYGVEADIPEVAWFYDRDSRPSQFEGPVDVTVFARFEDLGPIAEVSRRMRIDGAKPVRIDRP